MPRPRPYSKRDHYSGRAHWITPIPDALVTEDVASLLVCMATAYQDLWTMLTAGYPEPPSIGLVYWRPIPGRTPDPVVATLAVDEGDVQIWALEAAPASTTKTAVPGVRRPARLNSPEPKGRQRQAAGTDSVDEKGVLVWGPSPGLTVVADDGTGNGDASGPGHSQ